MCTTNKGEMPEAGDVSKSRPSKHLDAQVNLGASQEEHILHGSITEDLKRVCPYSAVFTLQLFREAIFGRRIGALNSFYER